MPHKPEFHDLSEALLNAESGHQTLWGNLGFWQSATTYPDACQALADKLASAVQLKGEDNVVDIGFGCGDQLLHWIKQYQVTTLSGQNLSLSQTEFALDRLRKNGHEAIADQLYQGSCEKFGAPLKIHLASASVVLSLDCAYHFPERKRLFKRLYDLTPGTCRYGFTDILLARRPGFIEKIILTFMLTLSRIPHENLMQRKYHQAQLLNCGWKNVTYEDITDDVFTPFVSWLQRYKVKQVSQGCEANWQKYSGTAWFLNWAAKRKLLQYHIVVLSK